jgi:hypothetical protein
VIFVTAALLGLHNYTDEFSIWISSSSAGSGLSGSSCFLESSLLYTAEEVDGVGDKVTGILTTVNVQVHFDAYLNMSLRCVKLIKLESRTSVWDCSQVLDYWES